MMNRAKLYGSLVALCLASAAMAAEPQGPAIGKNSYASSIATVEGVADTDDYVATLVKGERLTVTVTSAKGSALYPALTLIAPDGSEVAPPVAAKKGGHSLLLKGFEATASGRWAVRIAGKDATQGAYSVAFSIAAAPPVKVRHATVTGIADIVKGFDAVDGSLLDVTMTWRDAKAPMEFRGLDGPSGNPVTGVIPVVKGRTLSIKGFPLFAGSGAYALRIGGSGMKATYDLSVTVRPQGRPSARKPVALSSVEPFLALRDTPLRGAPGFTVKIDGIFDPSAPPSVRIGQNTAISTVAPDGKSMNVIVPDGLDGSTVAVTAISPDGQVSERDAYFTYARLPSLTGLVDADGVQVPALPVEGGAELTLRGTGFETGDRVFFGATEATVLGVDGTTEIRVVAPASTSGTKSVKVRDLFNRDAISGFQVEYVNPPTISAVTAVGGAMIDGSHVAVGGGATIQVSGPEFHATDVVTVDGAPVAIASRTATTLRFTMPAGAIGSATVAVTNVLGQSAVLEDALSYVGYEDTTTVDAPPAPAVDNLTALRGATADFDGDGTNDVAIVSDDTAPGTRSAFTRLFFGSSTGLVDGTSQFPAVHSDPAGVDVWKARAIVASDIDGNGSPDILIAGSPVAGGTGADFEARFFPNAGDGSFTFSADSPRVQTDGVTCLDTATGEDLSFFSPAGPGNAKATALAIGDLDGDGQPEIVMATDHSRASLLHIPADYVYWDGDSASMYYASNYWSNAGTPTNAPALRVFSNRLNSGEGFVDVTFPHIPLGGTTGSNSGLPAFLGRDVKLGDVDGDGSLDIVVTWDDPRSVTADDLASGSGTPHVATRVLLNDGRGWFTDATDTWMPAGSGNEYWQANRVELVDLDGDGDLDMVLVAKSGRDLWNGSSARTSSALRILRNDGPGVGFVDVTNTALPSMPLAGTSDDDLRGGALVIDDVDGDGKLDLLVGTTDKLTDTDGNPIGATRILRGVGTLAFAAANEFLPAATTDTGEASDLLIGDFSGSGVGSLLLVTETPPRQTSGQNLRTFTWQE